MRRNKEKMKKIKVLIVSDYAYPSGGIEVFIDEIITATNALIEYRVLTWLPSSGTKAREELVPTYRINCGDISGAWDEMDWADVVFFQTSWNVRLLATLVRDYCNISNKPLVTVIHTTSNSNDALGASKYQSLLLSEIINLSKMVVGVSQDVINSLRSLNMAHNNYQVIENASRFQRVNKKLKTRKTIAFVGRPTAAKGIDIFIGIVENLADTDLRFKLNTVSLPPPEEVKKFSKIETSYLLSNEELMDFYDSIDLLVVPYRHSDGLPLTVLEALSCGVPIIGLESLGVTDVLNRHKQMVVKSNNVTEISQIIRSWANGAISIELPKRIDIPTWKQQAKKYAEIFEIVLNG